MEFDQNTSFRGREQIPATQFLAENIEVDVAIIGGGYTGLSAAYHIKQEFPEKEVVVLEAVRLGHGASGRNRKSGCA